MKASEWRKRDRKMKDVTFITAFTHQPVSPEPVQVRLYDDAGNALVIAMTKMEAYSLGERLMEYSRKIV